MRRRLTLVRRPDPRRTARRWRALGVAVLLTGIGAAGVIYWYATHRRDVTIDELLPNLRAARARQVGILYGRGVEAMWDVYQDLKEPIPLAVMTVALSALGAAGCFRLAWASEPGLDR